MSPEKFKKRKLKEKFKETLEIIGEQKALETKRKKKKKSELDLKKEKKEEFEAIEEEVSVVKDIADKMNLEEKKRKRKERTSKLGLKEKDAEMMHLNGIGHEDEHQEDKGAKKEKIKRSGSKKKKRRESGNDVDDSNKDQIRVDEHVEKEEIHLERIDQEDSKRDHKETEREKKSKLGLKKKRKRKKLNETDANGEEYIHADDSAADYRLEKDHAKRSAHSQALIEGRISEKSERTKIKTKKVKNKVKHKQKDSDVAKRSKSEETLGVENVEEIQSVDEDCSRGMKKWLIQYKESRLGLKILQERIDDFITAYEERQEQERKEREAQAAEGGWTVVVHHKGRKKTTDAETGVTVGSVAEAAVVDKMGKKKSKEVPLDFYRFQKREAQRNEVMMLRSKFEQDKKRIQQLRAARKFRPY